MVNKIKAKIGWNIKDFFMVIFGSILYCCSMNIFIVPNHLYSGGVMGIAQLIRSICTEIIGLKINFDFSGALYYLINIPLFFVAYKYVSKTFFIRTLFSVTIQALLLSIIPIPNSPIVDDLLVCVLIGGIISGVGIGIILSCGSSSGGTDIIGIALSQKNNDLSVGKLGLAINVCIFIITGVIFGIERMIYSIIYSAIDNVTVDKCHEQNICSTAFIFSKKNPKKINEFIKNELHRDFTYWYALGGYNDSRTYIIYTALSKYELLRLEKFIKNIDDSIFIVKSEGVGIKGEFKKVF